MVPAYDSEATIKKCIVSLLNVDYPKEKMEIVVVDDGSTDDTENIVKSHKKVNLISQKHKGPAAARNLGVKSSRGEIIIFTDSDCVVPRNWIKSLLENFSNDVVAVGGGLTPYSIKRLSEKFEQYRRESLYGKRKRFVDTLPCCNLGIRREILEEVGGFDEDFEYSSSEDYELCYRIRDKGYKILYDPSASIIHFHSQSWLGVLRRAFIHGREGVKLRRKRKYPLSKEFLPLCKSVVLPLLALKRYPPKLIAGGFLYDFVSMLGQMCGILKYCRARAQRNATNIKK